MLTSLLSRSLNKTWKLIGLGILFGLLFHFTVVIRAYHGYKRAIRESKFSSLVFKNDPSIGNLFALATDERMKQSPLQQNMAWRLVVNMGVLDWNSGPDDIAVPLKSAIESQGLAKFQSQSTIEYMLDVARRVGADQSTPNEQQDERLKDIIATCIADGPGGFDTYAALAINKDASRHYENNLAFLMPREFGFYWGNSSTQQDLVNALFIHTRIADLYNKLLESPQASDQALSPARQYTQVNSFFQRLLLSMHDDPKIISAKNWLTIVEGPEQFFMYIVFGLGFMILLQSLLLYHGKLEVAERGRRFSRTLYKWVAIALPSIGFIGTKRGLSEALSHADTIVRANNETSQALAVSNVSETMGIAFTSTLVGLVLLMILMLLDLGLKYYNHKWDEEV